MVRLDADMDKNEKFWVKNCSCTLFGRGFGGFGGPGGEPPEGFSPPSGSDMPDMSELLDNMPFSILFESIVKAVDTGILVVICVCGLVSIRKFKKLTE